MLHVLLKDYIHWFNIVFIHSEHYLLSSQSEMISNQSCYTNKYSHWPWSWEKYYANPPSQFNVLESVIVWRSLLSNFVMSITYIIFINRNKHYWNQPTMNAFKLSHNTLTCNFNLSWSRSGLNGQRFLRRAKCCSFNPETVVLNLNTLCVCFMYVCFWVPFETQDKG